MRQLVASIGWCSETGRRPDNQDFVAAIAGTATQRARFGLVAAIADGVGGHKGGRVASETAVRGFIDAYLGQSETVGVRRATARAVEAVNGWIHQQGLTDPANAGMATTLTAVVLRHRTLHVLHVGDSRLLRVRDGQLAQLTTDHVMDGPEQRHLLRRAVGLEDAVRAEALAEPLQEGDRLVLLTDGVHGALRPAAILRLLQQEPAPDRAAASLVRAALGGGSEDNATALVLDVLTLPEASQQELAAEAEALPLRPPPRPGDTVDSYLIERLLAEGRYTALFVVTDQLAVPPATLVLKFPKPTVAEDETYRAAFMREGWVAARVRSPWLGGVIEQAPGRRTSLYTAMPLYEGGTLEARLLEGPAMRLREGVRIGAGLAKGVAALHRAGIVHRDIKPENVMLGTDGQPRLIDFGVVRLPGLEDEAALRPDSSTPGTPSYMAPELLAGDPGSVQSDVFALGVTLYRMFTGTYPYGEIEPFQRPVWRAPAPLQQRRPDLPGWLDLVLARAVAVDPKDRPGDAMELALELDGAIARPAPPTRRAPLLSRNPVRFWQACCLVLLVLLALSALWRR